MRLYFILVFSLLILTACDSATETAADSTEQKTTNDDTIFYVSLNQAIHQGQYDGVMQVGELKQHGNFGVGSTARLSEELVLLRGVAYGIPADGRAYELPDSTWVPFASVKHFVPDEQLSIDKPLTLQELEAFLDSVLTKNSFAAIRVRGKFTDLRYRSFNPQDKPYRPIDQVPDVMLHRSGTDATLVGFFTPESAEVLNSPVYHFHFVDRDRTTGGHILDLALEQAEVEIDYAAALQVKLPDPTLLQHINLNRPPTE